MDQLPEDSRCEQKVVLLGLRTIEVFMTNAKLLEPQSEVAPLASGDVRRILSEYEHFVGKWSASEWSDALFDVGQRSRELLVKWIALCIVHRNAGRSCALVHKFGIALDWRSLRVAVLKEDASIRALMTVAWYIRSTNHPLRLHRVLFNLENIGPTFLFARQAASKMELYTSRYKDWIRELNTKVADCWREVARKKQLVDSLRSDHRRRGKALPSETRARRADTTALEAVARA